MKRILVLSVVIPSLSLFVSGKNLVQNPGYENQRAWDTLWYLSFENPSFETAVATQVTTDAHEGATSLELSKTVGKAWTYYYTDVVNAPLHLLASRSYEVQGWMRFVGKARITYFSIFWNGSISSLAISPSAGLPQDFTHPVVYTVTAVDGVTTRDWMVIVTFLPNTATDILSFYLPDLPAPASINTAYHLVLANLLYGSDLTALTPFIEVSPGATIEPASGVSRDFTHPVIYMVTAEDGVTSQNGR